MTCIYILNAFDFNELPGHNVTYTRISCGGHFVNGSRRNEQFYRGPSIDASYQVSVHFVKGFQRRRLKCEKLRRTTYVK
jgi:hypothetical protein